MTYHDIKRNRRNREIVNSLTYAGLGAFVMAIVYAACVVNV